MKYSFLFIIICTNLIFAQNIIINEVMASNKTTIYDEQGEAPDWIELYNTGNLPIDLTGFYLSDKKNNPLKWQFGSVIIEPKGYLLIYASGKDNDSVNLHTNFKIDALGENVVLSDASGNIIDQINLQESYRDISYGRKSDGSIEWIHQTPSPGTSNTGIPFLGYADPITFSLPAGFYQSSIIITLSAGDSKIYYTLDGKDPNENSTRYTTQITITKTSVLKAISYKENYAPGEVIHSTYFINENSNLPVISLSSDPYNLFDYNYGIYADGPGWTPQAPNRGANFWMDWERPGHIEFFDDNKNLGFSKDGILSIYGAWTRAWPQKSFSVKFKDGIDALEYPLFPNFDVTTFKSFILRNSGNDFQYTHIRDAMMQTLIKDLDIDYLEYRPATTFINGDYWGIYNIREKISEHYVANRHGVDPSNIDMLESNMSIIHGDASHYQQLINFISNNDMTTDDAYNFVDSMIDLDECLLYFAAQVYYNNQDWPSNNIKYWREKSETGKWRWILYDTDFGFNLYRTNAQAEDHVYYLFSGIETRPGSNPPWSTLLPRKLVENPKIKNQFINLLADLLNTNFKSERVVNIINKLADNLGSDGERHRQRWGINQFTFNNHIQLMISFAQQRPDYLRGFLRNFFKCGNDGILNINAVGGGEIHLNSLKFKNKELPWSGIYFRNNKIHLKAIPEPGFKFDGWSGSITSKDESISIDISQTTNIIANFVYDSSIERGIVINEINYNSSDLYDSGDWVEFYNSSNQTIDMSNWYFSDSDDKHKFFFPNGTLLKPNQYLVLVEDEKKFNSIFPGVQNYLGEMDFGLSGSGELIRLFDKDGNIANSLTYSDKSPWPKEADGNGSSLELKHPLLDNTLGENWKASEGNGSPGRINSGTTDIKELDSNKIPEQFVLYQNYPNPFNPSTTIRFSIPSSEFVTLKIYNTLGQEVIQLISKEMNAGTYSFNWNAGNIAGGIYYYRITAGNYSETKKLLFLK